MEIHDRGFRPHFSPRKADESSPVRNLPSLTEGSTPPEREGIQLPILEPLSVRELVQELERGLEIREERVNEVQVKLRQGQYLAPQSAEALSRLLTDL